MNARVWRSGSPFLSLSHHKSRSRLILYGTSRVVYHPCVVPLLTRSHKEYFWSPHSGKEEKDNKEKEKEEEKEKEDKKQKEVEGSITDTKDGMFGDLWKAAQEKYQEVQTSMEETARKEEEERKERDRKERRQEILVFLGYTSLMLGFLGLIVILEVQNGNDEVDYEKEVQDTVQRLEDNLKRGKQPTAEEYCALIWDSICVNRSPQQTVELCAKWKQTTSLYIPQKEAAAYVSTLDKADRDLFDLVKKNIRDDTLALAVCVISKWEELRAKEDKISGTEEKLPTATELVAPTIKTTKEVAERRGLTIK